jgi:glycosyltransferase involved in cell wall biosynthesis
MTRRLRLGIDAHAIGERQTGNERFITNVTRALGTVCDHELILFVGTAAAADGFRGMERVQVRVMRPDNPAARLLWWFPTVARRDRLDALLVQYVGPPFVACPVVTVVHDVAFAVYPEFYSRAERMWMPRAIPATMRRAAGVVTVSRFSRDEIRRLYGISEDRVTVAYNGVDPVFLGNGDGAPVAPRVEPPYFLAVGNLQPRKNLVTLIRAYRTLVARHPNTAERLVVVGQEFYAADAVLAEAADLTRAGRIVFTGYVPDADLVALLRSATAFAYPSVYEGFGLPAVEAMAMGVPTLVSDVPVMREVTGDAAVRLPPTDPKAWADALGSVASDGDRRTDLANRGRRRAADFTWESAARQVLAALEAAASHAADARPPAQT